MVREPPKEEKLTPAVIANAPDTVPAPPALSDDPYVIPDDHPIWGLIRDLQVENESLQADNAKLTAETDLDTVRAKMAIANR